MNQQTEQAAGQVNAMRDTLRHQEYALTATADKVEVKTSEIEENLARQTEVLNQTSLAVT